jgi:hypothetical protein
MARLVFLSFAALLFLCAGCKAKLNYDKTFHLKKGDAQNFTIPAISSEQQVKISVQAGDGPVDVCVYLAKNKEKAEVNPPFAKKDLFLERKLNEKSVDFTVTVPANEEAIVYVGNVGRAELKEVTIKMTN